MAGETVVTVEMPAPEETPVAETPAVVVVNDSPAGGTGESAVIAFTLEMLAERIAALETENASLKSALESAHSRMDGAFERISTLEIVEVDEPEETLEEPGAVIAEVIPPEAAAPTEPPKERKRKFV